MDVLSVAETVFGFDFIVYIFTTKGIGFFNHKNIPFDNNFLKF